MEDLDLMLEEVSVDFQGKNFRRAIRRKTDWAKGMRKRRLYKSLNRGSWYQNEDKAGSPWWDNAGETSWFRPDAPVKQPQLNRWSKYSFATIPGWIRYYPPFDIEKVNVCEKADARSERRELAAIRHEEIFADKADALLQIMDEACVLVQQYDYLVVMPDDDHTFIGIDTQESFHEFISLFWSRNIFPHTIYTYEDCVFNAFREMLEMDFRSMKIVPLGETKYQRDINCRKAAKKAAEAAKVYHATRYSDYRNGFSA